MEIKEIGYENYGNCVEITNGVIDIVVTVDFGPRIVRFGFVESENVFYNDLDRKHSARFENFSALFGKNSVFYPYGGHRVWLSPAGAGHAGYPDNFSVVYSILPDSVVFTPPKQKHSDIQCGFEVVMGEDASDIMIIHTAKNYSKEAQTFGLWPITMVNGGGVVILPQNRDNSGGLEPNRLLSLWSGTDLHDPRIFCGNRYLTLTHIPGGAPLKIGINNVLGWIAYVEKDYTLMKRFVYNPQAAYPDFGCSSEVGFESDYAELASLSPIYRVEPGEGIKYVENLSLFKNMNCVNPTDEDGIARYIENLK